MRVVITKEQIEANRSCGKHFESPEWNESEQALIYEDWDSTVERLLGTTEGIQRLKWLVSTGLVPMTRAELRQRRKEA